MKKRGKVPRAVAAAQAAPKVNPFELKKSKKKFDVLGKRDKASEARNVIKSREDALEKRKKTLLVEYKQLRKANTFIDRRFGEDDPALNEEDRAMARFQVQRVKEAKKASRFALSGGDGDGDGAAGGGGGRRRQAGGDTLTHGGISLEELEELNSRPSALLADLDDDMLEGLVAQYHFGGGGGGPAAGQEGEEGSMRRMTKKEIMEEIIAKSKAAKAAKARQREDDEAALASLDDSFKQLVGDRGAGLAALVKPPGYDKGRKVKADNDADADYDRAARELAFEAKGQASERTLTKGELEEKEAARLAALEAARLKRMRADAAAADGGDAADGGGDEDAGAAAAAADGGELPRGGYAAKRARMKAEGEQEQRRQRRRLDASGDALEENFTFSSEEEEGGSDDGGGAANALEARRQAAAAGDHPLQQSLRAAAARLAAKHGVAVAQHAAAAADGSGSGSEDEEEGESGSEGSEDEGAAGSSGHSGGDDGSSGSEEGAAAGSSDDAAGSSEEEEKEEEEEEHPHPTKQLKKQLEQERAAAAAGSSGAAAAAAAAAEGGGDGAEEEGEDGPLDLSFTPPVPASYPAFAALVGGRPARQLALAIQRIRAFNATALVADSKRKLQVFYGILVQHFAMVAGQAPLPSGHLDVLTQVLLQLTPEVPFYAATVARTRLEHLHARLAAALTDPLEAGLLLGWPGPRQLLQLRLFALLFPTSDRRHPVTTPLALLLGKYLNQCPVNSPYQAATGLLLSGMALHNAAAAARFCPEAVNFVAATLHAFVPQGAAVAGAPAVSRFTPGLLAFSAAAAAAAAGGSKRGSKKAQSKQQQPEEQEQQQLPSIKLYQLLSSAPDAAELSSDAFKLQLLGCTVATVRRVLQLSHGCGDAAPQVLQPLLAAAQALAGARGGLPPGPAQHGVAALARELQARINAGVAARVPVVQSHRVKVVLPREFNPRFEADFNARADYDPDRSRSEGRKLARQLGKERRGAMRELRRDGAFMAAERDREKARVDAERLASERSFYSELQRQEADAKSGGQGGMNPHKKKRRHAG